MMGDGTSLDHDVTATYNDDMLYIIIALVFYTVALIITTIATRNTNSNLATGIINAIAAIVPIAVSLPILNKQTFQNERFGILMAVLAGILITVFAMALSKSFATNKVAIVAPIVFGGSIFLSALLSSIFLKERISSMQAIGLFFLGIGLLFIIYAKMSGR